MAELQHPIREAERYLQNAKQILSDKAGKDGNMYNDSKYVRMAGDMAWKGVLIALDATLGVRKGLKRNQRPDIQDYQNAVAMRDRRMSKTLRNAYELLHKSIGYDGVSNYVVVQSALADGQTLIDWADRNYHPTPKEIAAWQHKPNIFQRIYSFLF